MNSMKKAQLSLGLVAVGMTFFSVAPKPADSGIPVSVIADLTATTIATQQASQRSTIAFGQHADMALSYAKQVVQWQQEITELTKAKSFLKTPGNLSSLTNEIVTLNNQNPTTAGTQLANILVSAQNGSIGANSIGNLQNEAIAAFGNLSGHQANVDGSATVAAAVVQDTDFQATMENQNAADLNNARFVYREMLDVTSGVPVTLNGGTTGFQVSGIKDYSDHSML